MLNKADTALIEEIKVKGKWITLSRTLWLIGIIDRLVAENEELWETKQDCTATYWMKEAERLLAENEELRKQRDEQYGLFLLQRGVDTPCTRCRGLGVAAYGDSSTWRRGGCAGQQITSGVCDLCWGTGDANKKGADLRRLITLQSRLSLLESERDSWKGKAEFARDGVSNLSSECFNLSAERDRLRKGLEEIVKYPTCGLTAVEDVNDIARTALESSQPEGREATVEELASLLQEVEKSWEVNNYKPDLVIMVATHLLDRFDVRRR